MSSCVVEARSVTKDFKVAQKPSGRFSTLRHLVRRRYRMVRAVDGVSFSIHAGSAWPYWAPTAPARPRWSS